MEKEHLYHIYNQGNNRDIIFFQEKNYIYFLKKVRIHLLTHLEIFAYCLMPNHFHFLAKTRTDFDQKKFTNSLRTLLSSYTKAINKQKNRTGSLFRQNTKIINISDSKDEQYYGQYCFQYIHQNPLKSGLVKKMNDWKYSSYSDYTGLQNGTLCNKSIAREMLNLPEDLKEFRNLSLNTVPEHILKKFM